MARGSFREQVLRVREDAIISSVNRLLAEKGFDLMTVDEVAADVGIAKASLYKHFASKEALAAAAMVRVLERGAALLAEQAARPALTAARRACARWRAGRWSSSCAARCRRCRRRTRRCAPNCWAARPMSTC
jgi:TetR/AcrR family transcriptional regulator of autoinduction and epiphytic fitness